MNEKIGIMGGSFDPIHFGHLRAAEEAKEALSLSRVIFIPTGNPPHKSALTDANARFEMTRLATRDKAYFSVSRLEIDSNVTNYTLDTLMALIAMPEYETAEFYFITGLDSVLDIINWKQPEKIITLCKLVAVGRPGYNAKKLAHLPTALRNAIILLEISELDISSTQLRQKVAAGRSISYLVPPEVENYIKEHKLYV